MPGEGSTHYDLTLGVDTSGARRDVDLLERSGRRLADTTDTLAAKNKATAGSSRDVAAAAKRQATDFGAAAKAGDRLGTSQDRVAKGAVSVARNLAAAAGVSLGLARAVQEVTKSLRVFTELETGVVSVGKTTDLTVRELDTLFDTLLLRSTTDLPVATSRMLELGAAAGQLGVEGSENISAYIETLGQMEVATDLVGEAGAKSLARILNVSGEAQGEVGRLGSVIVRMGNEAAASESEIVDLATEVALATAQFRLGSTFAVAFGTAMKESGIEAEAGGTAIGRTLREIQSAIAKGGKELTAFAEISGVSIEAFRQAWEDSPADALNLFLEGLGELGPAASLALERVGLGSDRLAKSLPTLAVNYDRLRLRQSQAADEAERMTALTTEAGRFFDRTGADLDRLSNAAIRSRAAIGEGMAPAVREVALEMRDWLNVNRDAAQSLGEDLGQAVRAGGEVILFLARNVDLLQAAVKTLIALKLAQWLSQGVAWLNAYAASATRATAAQTALNTATAASIPIYGAQGQVLSRVTVGGNEVAKTSTLMRTRFGELTTGGIRPLTVGLTGVLGVILLLNEAAKSWGDEMDRQIRRILEQAQQFGERTKGVQDEVARLLDAARFQREFEAELFREGISDPQSDEALRVRERMEADLHRERVDRLTDWKSRLAAVHDEMDRVGDRMREIREVEIPRAEAQREAAPTQEMPEFQQATADLARLREELAQAQVEFRDLNTEQTILQRALPGLDTATRDYVATLGDLDKTLEGTEPDKAAQKFAKLLETLRQQRDLNLDLADAYGLRDEAAQRAALQGIEAEERFADITRDLTAEQIALLRELGLVQEVVNAERRAAGAKTLSDLDRQIQGQTAVNAAYVGGAEAVARATREQKIAEAQAQATEGAHADQVDTIREWVRALTELQEEEEALRQVRDLDRETQDLLRLEDAYDGGLAAVESMQAVLRVENEIRQQTIDLLGQERLRVLEATAARERAQARAGSTEIVADLEDQLDAAKELQKIRRGDFLTERQYQQALRMVNIERELEIQLNAIRSFQAAEEAAIRATTIEGSQEQADALRNLNDEYQDLIDQAKAASRETAKINIGIELDTSTTKLDAWVEAGRSIADALREVNEELGSIADAAVDVLASFEHIGTAAGKIDFAVAAGDLVGSIGQAITGPSNYAAEGALVGAIIGAIIGGYVTGGTAAGVQAGAAIGSSAGGALGSFIKKGADEFIAEFELSASGGLDGLESKVEGEMGGIGRRYMEAVERGIEDALDQLGAFLVGIPDIGIKVREGMYSVTVGAAHAIFGSMEEAVDFAILQLLRQGDIIGLSPEVQQAIQNSTAETFDALMEQIDFAQWFERLPEIGQAASQAATALFDAVTQFQKALRMAAELGFDTAKIEQWFAHTLTAIRNNVLGIVETNEERIRREAAGFNATVQLMEAEQAMRKADLILKREELKVELELLAAKEGITVAELQAQAALLEGQGSLVQATISIAYASAEAAAAIVSSLAAIEQALATVDTILANLPNLISEEEIQDAIRRAGGGGGQRKRDREEALERIEDLRLLASGMGESALDLRRELEDFDEWVAQAKKLGIAEADLAQARLDNLKLLEDDVLAGARDATRGADPAGVREILDRYVESLEEAAVLAAARAKAAGTTVAEEFARLAAELAAGFGAELAAAIRGSLPGLVGAGDRRGLEDFRDSLLELADSLPPSLAGELSHVAQALALIDQALAVMDALGLGGPISGVDTSSIEEYLDMARGISAVDRELRTIQQSFLAVWTEAQLAGASQEDLALIQEAYGEALRSLRESVLDSVREYLDAAEGIGEFERKLLDLQETFRNVREGLEVLDRGEGAEDTLFGAGPAGPLLRPKDIARRSGEVVAAQVEEIERVVTAGLIRLVEEARRILGVEEPADRRGDELGRGRRQVPEGLRPPRGVRDDILDRIRDAIEDTIDSTDRLADELDDLEDAERRAIRQLGIDFIGSLEDLGVALPTDLTLELAQAQFALAQAEAISSALALAAAGAFDGMSISLAELLDLLAGASFGDSAFAPRDRPSGGSRKSGPEQDLESDRRRVEEQLRAWDRMALGDAASEAVDFAETLRQVEADAQAAGVSLDSVRESYRRAVGVFVDDALAEFEDMDLSPLEQDLQAIQDHFVDLIVGFETIGASQEDMLRLGEAFTLAMEDFLERATSGIRAYAEELRAEDPRRSSEQRFTESQAAFQDLLARAQSGDLEAIQELEAAARDYRQEAVAFLGFGVGSQEVLDLILAGLDSISDVELVPEDIALLREQAERLLALIEIADAQPTRDSTDRGVDRITEAIDDDKTTSESLLDLILDALEDGHLEVIGIGDVLDVLGQLVALTDLTGDEIDRILSAVSGVVKVADDLSPKQLENLVGLLAKLGSVDNLTKAQQEKLFAMVNSLLGLNTLSDAQRKILEDILGQGAGNKLVFKGQADTLSLISTHTFAMRSELWTHGDQFETMIQRLVQIREAIKSLPKMETGGYVPNDGLVYLHAGERVLTRRQTQLFDASLAAARAERSAAARPVGGDGAAAGAFRGEGGTSTFAGPVPVVGALAGGGTAAAALRELVALAREEGGSRRELSAVRRAIEEGDRHRSAGEGTAARLSVAELEQEGQQTELQAELVAEVAALRRELRRSSRGLVR